MCRFRLELRINRRLFLGFLTPCGRHRSFRSVFETAACGCHLSQRIGCFCPLFTGLSLPCPSHFFRLFEFETAVGGTMCRNSCYTLLPHYLTCHNFLKSSGDVVSKIWDLEVHFETDRSKYVNPAVSITT